MRLLNQMLNLLVSGIFDCFSRRFDKVVFNLKLSNLVDSHLKAVTSRIKLGTCENRRLSWVGEGGNHIPYILLNEIQTMVSQLPKRSAKVLPPDLRVDHVHYVKTIDQRFSEGTKNMAAQGRTVSHNYILVIRKFIDFMLLLRHSL